MRFLLDEGLPVQLLEPLRRNRGHDFVHVQALKWKSKEDEFLFPDAASRKFDAIMAPDLDQLVEPTEWKALKRSGLHHITVRQGQRARGLKGLARLLASVIVAMPYVIEDLDGLTTQHFVEITLLGSGKRHELLDPAREKARFPYWH